VLAVVFNEGPDTFQVNRHMAAIALGNKILLSGERDKYKWQMLIKQLSTHSTENPIYVFPEMNPRGLVPN
jgi:hypothetical protein